MLDRVIDAVRQAIASTNGQPGQAPDAETAAPPAPEKEFGIGVLFVEGLDEARRGGTVVAAADSLHACFERLITRDHEEEREHQERRTKLKARIAEVKREEKRKLKQDLRELDARRREWEPPVALRDVRLKEDPDDQRAPAHLTMCFAATAADGCAVQPNTRRWCLAESWPAQDFQPPSLTVMTRWVLKVAPMIVFKQFAKTLRLRWLQRPPKWLLRLPFSIWGWRMIAAALIFVLAPVLSLLAVVPALLALVLATLPVPKVSAAIRRASTRIGTSMGDSYVLLESPARFAALVNRVERDLEWLAARCDRVAVVAFGQGATVTHRHLQQPGGPEVALYVTVGSGLRKVAEMALMRRASEGLFYWVVPATVASFALLLLASWVFPELDLLLIGSMFIGAFATVFAIAIFDLITRPKDEEPRIRAELSLTRDGCSAPPWTDVFASFDPVSNGPMFEQTPHWLDSREIWTHASTLGDHRAYWHNPDAFVAPLCRQLADLVGDPWLSARLDVTDDQIAHAVRRRTWRLGWLIAIRFMVLAAALFAGARLWADVVAAARSVTEATPAIARTVIETLATPIREPVALLGVGSAELLGAVLVVAAALVAYAPERMLWALWNTRDVKRFFRREPADIGGAPVALGVLVTFAVLSLLLKLGATGSWSRFAEWFEASFLRPDIFVCAVFAFTLAFVVTNGIHASQRRRLRAAGSETDWNRDYRRAVSTAALNACLASVLVAMGPADDAVDVFASLDLLLSDPTHSPLALGAIAWGATAPLLALLLAPVGRWAGGRIVGMSTAAPKHLTTRAAAARRVARQDRATTH